MLASDMVGIVADGLNSPHMADLDTPSPSLLLTLLFALAVSAGMLLKLWLASRQIRHVARHRSTVPQAFAARIGLAAHQKAADYTIAKTRLELLELALGTAVLLGWTLLGGLSLLNQALLQWLGGGMLQQLALLAAFVLISGFMDLPLSLYKIFVQEKRFGFNHMTPKLWLIDLCKSTLLGAAIGLPIAAAILWLMGRAGAYWWAWAWGVSAPRRPTRAMCPAPWRASQRASSWPRPPKPPVTR